MKLHAKKIVLLVLVTALVLLNGYGMYSHTEVPKEFTGIVTTVMLFYFGVSKGLRDTNRSD